MVNYISQYANLLPLLLLPLFKAFGTSITSYSIMMCILSALGMVAVFGAFTEVTRGVWRGLALYVPVRSRSASIPGTTWGPYREFDGIYYAVFPGRYFGPFVFGPPLFALHVRGRRIPIWALFGFSGLVGASTTTSSESVPCSPFPIALGVSWDRSVALRRPFWANLDPSRVPPGCSAPSLAVTAITLIRTGEGSRTSSLLTYFNRLFLQESYGLEPMSHARRVHWGAPRHVRGGDP